MASNSKNRKKNKFPAKAASVSKCDAILDRMQREEESDNINSKLTEVPEASPLIVTKLVDFPRDKISEMFSMMVCRNCDRVPSPFQRFLCPAGHLLCLECGRDRVLKHGAKCLTEIGDEKKDSLYDKEEQAAPLPEVPLTKAECQENPCMLKIKSPHFPLCQEKLKFYKKADPIFAAFWMTAEWKCPFNSDGGRCSALIKGQDLYDHVVECPARPARKIEAKTASVCAVDGCKTEVTMSDAVPHLISKHKIYAMDLGNGDDSSWRTGGLLYVPQSAIQERRPYYIVIRFFHRFFLFCMEPSSTHLYDMCFWIRRISNKDNMEEDKDPWFCYDLFLMSKFADLKMTYKKGCVTWRKSSNKVFRDVDCLAVARTMLLDQFVVSVEDTDESSTDGEDDCYFGIDSKEKGYLPVKFKIFVGNDVGQLYWKEPPEPPLKPSSSMESLASITNKEEYKESYKLDAEIESGFMTDESGGGESETGSESSASEREFLTSTPGPEKDDRQGDDRNENFYPQSKFNFESHSEQESEGSFEDENNSANEAEAHSCLPQIDEETSEDEGNMREPENETSRLTEDMADESGNRFMRNMRLSTEFHSV